MFKKVLGTVIVFIAFVGVAIFFVKTKQEPTKFVANPSTTNNNDVSKPSTMVFDQNDSILSILDKMQSITNIHDAVDIGTTTEDKNGAKSYLNTLYGISFSYPSSGWYADIGSSLMKGGVSVSNYDPATIVGDSKFPPGANKLEVNVGAITDFGPSQYELTEPDYPHAKPPVTTHILISSIDSVKIFHQLGANIYYVRYIIPIPHTNNTYALNIVVYGDRNNFSQIENGIVKTVSFTK